MSKKRYRPEEFLEITLREQPEYYKSLREQLDRISSMSMSFRILINASERTPTTKSSKKSHMIPPSRDSSDSLKDYKPVSAILPPVGSFHRPF